VYSADDRFYPSTRLLLKFDDVDNLATTVDQTKYQEPVTLVAPATLTTTTAAAGSGSLSLGSTGYLQVPDTSLFDLSNPNVPFTFEMFLRRPDGIVGEAEQLIFGKWDTSGATRSFALEYRPAQRRLVYSISSDGTAETTVINYPWTEAEPSAWQHVSLDRLQTGIHVLRINGQVVQTALNPGALAFQAIPFNIGGYTNPQVGEGSYQAEIDSFRYTFGRNRYDGIGPSEVPVADYPT
jgi:hypothetical protein